jgi:leucyl aminopeptidase (aminopeptidase T)
MSHGRAAFDNVLDRCLAVRAREQVVLLADDDTDGEVVAGLVEGIARRGAVPVVATMPGVRLETFRPDGPLAVDFDELRLDAERVGTAWDGASRFRLSTPAGTHLTGSVDGRPGRVLHGVARVDGAYMAPPDVEAGTAPIEGSVNGVVVVDADLLFMGRGPLAEPVMLHIDHGELAGVEGAEAGRLRDMLERCGDDRMRNLAEVSVAFNPSGRVCSVPMETESSRGSAHIALGNSIAYGGLVDAVAHLDCVMTRATLELDGRVVMSEGVVT